MTTFDDRDKGFENKFAHDEELAFKANARRNKLLGLWAAAKLGKNGPEAEGYARDTVEAEFQNSAHTDIVEKLLKDFAAAGVAVSAKEIHAQMDILLQVARKQIMGDDH